MNAPQPPKPEDGARAQNRPLADDELIRYWDGIAAFLQVSVKTAQRYEKEFGLPVRRKRGPKGAVVYALRGELEAWLAEQPQTPPPPTPVPARRRPWVWPLALAVLIAAGGAAYVIAVSRPRPEAWRLDQHRLLVTDARGVTLWNHTFDTVLQPANFDRQGAPAVQPNIGEFVDLDGDGRREFLFLVVSRDEYKKAFYCFEHDGSVRFSVRPGVTVARTLRYGENTFAPPYGVARFVVVDEPDGRKSVLVISYDPTWFPSVVQKYDAAGRLNGEFWNDGRLWEAKVVELGGRRLLFAGGANNEHHAAGLAVLDYNHIAGSAPATNPHYRCANCPAGGPLAYFVFPQTDVARAVNAWPHVWRVNLDAPDRLSVWSLQTREPLAQGGPPGLPGALIYGFDSQLKLRSAEHVEGYRAVHGILTAAGRLDHAFGPRDERELYPVLRWNGRAFEQVTRPQ
ncbi:MAG TPA: hypothetical protein DEH78_06895 [Solibacterales bacterium]|nr:hypothetical protein [Bryobacterales bacterium]